MPALADSPARIVQRTIIDVLGLGTDPDDVPVPSGDTVWATYYDQLPPQKPDRAIAVVNVLGQSDGRDQRTGELFAHFGFHVTVRAPTGEGAWRRTEAVRAGLAEDATGAVVLVNGSWYRLNAATQLGQAFRVGVDGGRVRYSLTGTLSVTSYTFPVPGGLYRFDGNANDSSPNSRHFTPTGDEGYGAGVFGSGLQSGAPSRSQNLLTGSVFGGSYTVAAWFTRLASGTVTVVMTDGLGTQTLKIVVAATTASFTLAGSAGGFAFIAYSEAYPVGQPRHVCLSVDRGFARVYLDGDEEATYDVAAAGNDPASLFESGGTGTLSVAFSAADRFRVDELVVLPEALPPGAVAALARGTARYPV